LKYVLSLFSIFILDEYEIDGLVAKEKEDKLQ